MRRQDELISIYGGQSPLARKFLISQMEGLSRAFDSEELLDFLQTQLGDADAVVRTQTLYTVAQFLPGFVQRRYAVSSQTMGTWSQYGAPVGGQPSPSRHDIRKRIKAPKVHQAALLATRPIIDAMVARIGELDGWNRTRALLALGHFGLRSSRSWLVERMKQVRPDLAVGLALAEIGSEDASAAILSAVRQYGSIVPELYFLLSPAQGPGAASLLLSSIPRTDTVGRMNLARALATFSVSDIQSAFARLRDHHEGWVECFALSSIEAASSPALLPTVIEAHRGARHWFIANAALKAAGGIRCGESIDFCIHALKDPAPRVAAVALESLVRLRTPSAELRAAATPFLTSPDMKARVNAILAAVDAADAPEARPLVEMLISTEPLSRLEAAYCLGYLQSNRALDLLGMLATLDPAYVVRHQAVKSLSKYPAEAALKHLLPIMLSDDARLALTSARVVARYEDDEARTVGNALAEALRTAKTNFTRAVLYRSLGQVTSRTDFPEGRAALAGGLGETDAKVLSGVLSGWVLAGPGGAEFATGLLAEASLDKTPRLRARLMLARWNCGDLEAPRRIGEMLASSDPDQIGPALDAALEISMMIGEAAIGLRFPELSAKLSERTQAPDFGAFVDEEGEAPPLFKERLRLPEVEFDVRASGPRKSLLEESMRPVARTPSSTPPPPPEPVSTPLEPLNNAAVRTEGGTLTGVHRPARTTRPVEAAPGSLTVSNVPAPAAREQLRAFLSGPRPTEEESPDELQSRMQKVTYLVPERFAGEGPWYRAARHPLTWLAGVLALLAVLVPVMSSHRSADDAPAVASIPVPEGYAGHLWFAALDGPCFVVPRGAPEQPAELQKAVRPGWSVRMGAKAEATLKTPTDDTIVVRGPAAFVLDSVTRPADKPHYRLREVAGELQIEFNRGGEVELVLDQRTVETAAGTLQVSRTSRGAQQLELIRGTAAMVDPLGRMELTPQQKLLYDE